MHLTRDEFATWLAGYIEAWRRGEAEAIGRLFSVDCSYSPNGGHSTVIGREAIVEAWLGGDELGSWEAAYEPLAIEGEVHVATGMTRYLGDGGAVRDEYSNVFSCRFDDAGQCTVFSEWWMHAPSPVERLE